MRVLPGFFIVVLAVFSLIPGRAQATIYSGGKVYTYDQIQFNAAVTVGTSQNNLSGNGYLRITKDDTLYVDVSITMANPATLNIFQDKLDDPYYLSSINPAIEGAGVAVERLMAADSDQISPASISGGKCETTSFGAIGYYNCPTFTHGQSLTSPGTAFSTGHYTFQIGPGDPLRSGWTSSATGDRFFLGGFPYLDVAKHNLTGNGQGISIYVFGTQAQVDAANQGGAPTDLTTKGGSLTTGTGGVTIATDFGIVDLLNKFFAGVFALLQSLVYAVFSFLIAPTIQAVLSIHPYTDTFVNVIYPGWEIVRNVANMFFIVALIAIGMATLLRIESYHFRNLLVQIILAALLVNFSLVVGQAVLAVADTVQNQFLPNNTEVIRSLGYQLMVKPNLTIFTQSLFGNGGGFATTIEIIFNVALALGTFCVFAAIAIFLVIRIVALWILLLVSPVAYVAGVLPSTAGIRGQWWSNFLKYTFFTPIMAFFLNMAAVMASSLHPILQDISAASFTASNSANLTTFVFKSASTILLLIFLIASIMVAEQFGIYGAKEIGSFVRGGTFAPFKAIKAGIQGPVARTYSKMMANRAKEHMDKGNTIRAALYKGAGFLNPVVAKRAWEERSKEKEMEAYTPATGYSRDALNRIIPTEWHLHKKKGQWLPRVGLGQKTYYGRIGEENMIAHKEKEWENAELSEEEKVKAYRDAHHLEDKEAIRRLLIRGRHEDGLQIAIALDERAKKEEEYFKQFKKEGDSDNIARAKAHTMALASVPAEYDAVEDLDSAVHDLKEAGASDEEVGRILSTMDELGESETKLRAIGNSVFEEHEKKFRAASDFKGYQSLQEAKGTSVMLDSLASAGIFEKITEKQKDAAGNEVEVTTGLKFKGSDTVIKDYASLEKVLGDTKGKSKEAEENLRYELTGARKQMSAQKRVERGDSERWGQALEPAAWMVQNDKGEFTRFTSYGRRSALRFSPLNINAFKKSRKLQARSAKLAGLYVNEKTGKFELRQPEILEQLYELNHDLAEAIIQKADLDDDIKNEIESSINTSRAAKGLPPIHLPGPSK